MAANRKSNPSLQKDKHGALPSRNVLLALSLVPMIAGVIFVIAWAMDWELVGSLENQAFLGLLFILFGFTLSNLFQRKWMLAAGWGLLTLADFLLLTQMFLWIQVPALILAAAGLLLLAIEFYRQYQRGQVAK